MKRALLIAGMLMVVLSASPPAYATSVQVTSGTAGALLSPSDGSGTVFGDHGLFLSWYTIGPVAFDIQRFDGLDLQIRGVTGEIEGIAFESVETIGRMTFSHRNVPRPSVLSGRPQFDTPFTMTGVLFPSFVSPPPGLAVPPGGYELVGRGVLHVRPDPVFTTTFEYQFAGPEPARLRAFTFIASDQATFSNTLTVPEPASWSLLLVAVLMLAIAHRSYRDSLR